MKQIRSPLIFFAVLACATYVYLYPGSQALFEGRTDTFLSDGTDPSSLPSAYDRLLQVWSKTPVNMFYGAVYQDSGDGDRGVALWFPWAERWLVVLSSYFFPLEQLSTAFIFLLFLINGIAMFLLGRTLGWSGVLSGALGFAWAINCYTRARAKVHGALVGQFHLPLIFLGLVLVVRGKSWRSISLAALSFFVAATTAHYYLITSMFLGPFFLGFVAIQPEFFKNWRKISFRLVVAVIPAVFLLGWTRFMALPPDAKMTAEDSMNIQWEDRSRISPFLSIFHAHPIDFLSGDLSLMDGLEINPFRALVDDHIKDNMGNSNTHERTNGIRWSVIALASVAIVFLFRGKFKKDKLIFRNMIFFCIFGLFGFWMSLGPDAPVDWLSPGYWIYSVFPKVRVASRAGIIFHFSLLLICGFFLAQSTRFAKTRWMPWALVALFFVDYLPLRRPPMAPIAPAYAELNRSKGACGTGIFFPFINPWTVSVEHYMMLQKMRGSDCAMLNQMTDPKKVMPLIYKFPPSGDFIASLSNNEAAKLSLINLARCVPLTWIAFHPAVASNWANKICSELGWQFFPDLTCISPVKGAPQAKQPELCF